jgi:hypothetical protein
MEAQRAAAARRAPRGHHSKREMRDRSAAAVHGNPTASELPRDTSLGSRLPQPASWFASSQGCGHFIDIYPQFNGARSLGKRGEYAT